MEKKKYNPIELMAVVASRHLEDGKLIFAGNGIPMLAAALAQKIHSPNLVLVFEACGISPNASMALQLPGDHSCSKEDRIIAPAIKHDH